jgi:hypothetical protein
MSDEARRAIVLHAARWANNILVEVLAGHGDSLDRRERAALRQAVRMLSDLQTPAGDQP